MKITEFTLNLLKLFMTLLTFKNAGYKLRINKLIINHPSHFKAMAQEF